MKKLAENSSYPFPIRGDDQHILVQASLDTDKKVTDFLQWDYMI